MITLIVLSMAFVCACIARRQERSTLATMPGCTIVWLQCLVALLYGYGRDRGEAAVIKATVDHAAQIRIARSRKTAEALAAGWLLN